MADQFDSTDIRFKRYQKAQEERDEKLYKFEEAYQFALPGRNKWFIKSPEYDKTTGRWDITAIESLQIFASNLQSLIMPPFQRWMSLRPDPSSMASKSATITQMLEKASTVIFSALEASNLDLEVNIAFQEMGISTGLIQIQQTGNKNSPLRFESVPMHNVVFSEYKGQIENIWRKIKIAPRDIKSYWPDAKLTDSLAFKVNSSPDDPVELIEGTIYYPENSNDSKYLYYVSELETKEDLLKKELAVSPWIAFRFSVSPGEVWGFGPVLQCLDYIRIANKIVEMEIKNAGYAMGRPLMVKYDQILNPYNVKIEPGSQIPVQDPSRPPIVPLDLSGDLRFTQVTLQAIQQTIRDMLFGDPLGPSNGPTDTATEIQIRQQNWIKKSTASFSRITNELLRPIVAKSAYFLKQSGVQALQSIKMQGEGIEMFFGDQVLGIDFISPVAIVQDQQDAAAFEAYTTALQNILTPQGMLLSIKADQVPQYLAEKNNIPSNLYANPDEAKGIIDKVLQGSQPQQPPPTQNIPSPNLTGNGAPSQTAIPQLNGLQE